MATEQDYPRTAAAREQGSRGTTETGQGMGGAREKVKRKARSMGERAKHKAGRMAESRKRQAAGRIEDVGERIERRAERLEAQGGMKGRAGRAVHRAGEKVEEGGNYLETHSVSAIRDDVEGGIRNHPFMTVGAALGTGLLAGWALGHGGGSEEEECEPRTRNSQPSEEPSRVRRAGKALLGGATAMAARGIRDRMAGRSHRR